MKTAVWWVLLVLTLLASGFALWWSAGEGEVEEEPALAVQLSPAGKAAAALAESRGCLVCHSVDGTTGIGPSWAASYGKPRLLQDGSSVVMDDIYLRRSMQDPAAQVVNGFENVMVPAELSDADIGALVGLIKELGTQ
jgi:cytochrome c oxidase subunit II